jgi:hypothetical protein
MPRGGLYRTGPERGDPCQFRVNGQIRKIFLEFALTPEKVADIIMDATRTRKFLVITSFDIKLLYFFKRSFPTLFHLIMLLLTRIMDKSLKRES